MYALGHHKNVCPGYIRYNEHRKYIDRSQQCIPWVIITMCIQGTQDIMNTVIISIVTAMCTLGHHNNVYPE